MFINPERSRINIKVAGGRSTQECFQELHEAYGDAVLPYRTMARWVKAFREGRDAVQDNLRTVRPHSSIPYFSVGSGSPMDCA